MDELKSCNILDEEIKAQAREKAQKILADGEKEVERIKASVEQRLIDSKNERLKKCEKELATLKKDLVAAKPLEEHRFLVAFLQSSIDKAIDEYIEKLSESKRLELLMRNFGEYAKALGEKAANVCVRCYGVSAQSVEKALLKFVSVKSCSEEGTLKGFGFVAENGERTVKVTCTSKEIFGALMDKKRKELCDILFEGKGAKTLSKDEKNARNNGSEHGIEGDKRAGGAISEESSKIGNGGAYNKGEGDTGSDVDDGTNKKDGNKAKYKESSIGVGGNEGDKREGNSESEKVGFDKSGNGGNKKGGGKKAKALNGKKGAQGD